jgi:hypothetical protein
VPHDLAARLDRLVRLHEIPRLFGVQLVTVKVWRGNAIGRTAGEEDHASLNVLPDPVDLPPSLARLVRDPVWDLDTLFEWGRQTGRLGLDNCPLRLGPPGRPRTRPRTKPR